MGAFDDALAVALKISKKVRAKTLAVVLFQAARWQQLESLLATVSDAREAVVLAWHVTYEADLEDE